ncbi:cation:proton antiporter [Amycolatopsis sp. cmx-11-51]|uniref:cation:proton antiporter n=1 Tax=unclassified Amycolatopsis TaxID=2618356 RepID=UPI0039E51103
MIVVLHVIAAVAVTLLIAFLAGALARRLGQPAIIGEIAAGLLVGPILVAVGGIGAIDVVTPLDVRDALHVLGQAGLVFFLVAVAYELKSGFAGHSALRNVWLIAGGLMPGLVAGGVLAVVVLGDPVLRGTAPAPALVVLLAIALAVTAVPVLARIVGARGQKISALGKLALGTAAVIDAVAWIGLAVAIGLSSGEMSSSARAIAVLIGGLVVAIALARLLGVNGVGRIAARSATGTAVVIVAVALSAALLAEHWGMTTVFGAFLVGLALPADRPGTRWSEVVGKIGRLGELIVPIFFVVTGIKVFTGAMVATPMWFIALATLLAIVAKVGGGYVGARCAGYSPWQSAQFGVLMNTRGLTEIVLLQAGYAAGILSAPLFIALIVMALVTTALTVPLLGLLGRFAARRGAVLASVLPPLPRPVREGRTT